MTRAIIVLFLMSALAIPARCQFGRDPLTPQEIDDLRDNRQNPPARLKLYVKYARQRMDTIERTRNDPRLAADRGPKLHDLIQDLGKIVEEMDDNVDTYAQEKWDIRKPLKEVVAADTEIQQKLTGMRDAAKTDAAFADELHKKYQFVLDDTLEAVKSCLASANETLQEQEAIAKDKDRKSELRKPEE